MGRPILARAPGWRGRCGTLVYRADLGIDIRLGCGPTLAAPETRESGVRGIEGLPAGRCVEADLTNRRAQMRLRDAFLVLVAALSVVAASVVVAAVSAGNRDWDLLVPLLALSVAGSVVAILATLFLTMTSGTLPTHANESASPPDDPPSPADPEPHDGDEVAVAADEPTTATPASGSRLSVRLPRWVVAVLNAVFV